MADRRVVPLEEVERRCKQLGDILNKHCPPGIGFCLTMAPFGGGDRDITYITNMSKDGLGIMLREFGAKLLGDGEG